MTAVPEAREVEGDGLLLRPWRSADLPQLEVIAKDPEILRWNPIAKPTVEEWLVVRGEWDSGEHASWAVTSIDDHDLLLGAISLHHIDLEQANSEVGYWVAPASRGRGVATRALRVAAAFGFEVLGLRRVHLFHAVENEGSCGVATAAGFPNEGTHRQSYRFGDGRWHDEHSHARLNDD